MFTGLFALLLAVGFVAAGWKYVSVARRMRTFHSTPGKIVARAVVPLPGGNTRSGVYGEGGGYMPSVRYRFAVDGAELFGDKISLAYAGYKHAVAERKLAEIPDDVVVWYDPRKPSDAYLKKHTPTLGIFILVLGAFVGLGALIKLVSSLGE
jgi:hypothetical protein